VDLREDQLNLTRHYVAKSLKKKASLRNLRDNNNGAVAGVVGGGSGGSQF
jgi:hypothetical protein